MKPELGEAVLHNLKNRGINLIRSTNSEGDSEKEVISFASAVLAFYTEAERICAVAIESGELEQSYADDLEANIREARSLAVALTAASKLESRDFKLLVKRLQSQYDDRDIVYQVVRGSRIGAESDSPAARALRKVLALLCSTESTLVLMRKGNTIINSSNWKLTGRLIKTLLVS